MLPINYIEAKQLHSTTPRRVLYIYIQRNRLTIHKLPGYNKTQFYNHFKTHGSKK